MGKGQDYVDWWIELDMRCQNSLHVFLLNKVISCKMVEKDPPTVQWKSVKNFIMNFKILRFFWMYTAINFVRQRMMRPIFLYKDSIFTIVKETLIDN